MISREIRQRLTSRSFAVTTVLLCVGIIGAGVLHRALSGDDSPEKYDVAVIGTAPDGFPYGLGVAAHAVGIEVTVDPIDDRAVAERSIRDGDVDVAIDAHRAEILAKDTVPDELAVAVDVAWRSARSHAAAVEAGLDANQITAIVSPAPLTAVALEPDADADDGVGMVVGFAMAILLFISINAFGGAVLTGVVEEKTTGVVEVLLAHLRAHQLLTGKVLGIGAVALVQLTAAVGAGLVALRIAGTAVPAAVWVSLPATLLWFVFGFVLYSTLFALAGSCVSRQEDAQGAAAPISIVFTAAYLTVFVLGAVPASTATRIVSVLPPFAPLLMPLRIAVGAASVVEIVVAAVALIGATVGMLRLAGAVYGATLLHRGSRLSWKQALRMRG
ncbi:MAG TPA: ABC transporter permease [Ilumatobacteraceae bacterium]|nr:ABC transporter permease [Ilumatobacteraceae bacterium]